MGGAKEEGGGAGCVCVCVCVEEKFGKNRNVFFSRFLEVWDCEKGSSKRLWVSFSCIFFFQSLSFAFGIDWIVNVLFCFFLV